MLVANQVVVVTGGASGIGRALAERFACEGARHVVVADRNFDAAREVARAIGGTAIACDVAHEAELHSLVEVTENSVGPISLFCSNAGIAVADRDPGNIAGNPDPQWMQSWQVNVMAHIYAARILIPRYRARRGGYFLNTISAAGLLTQLGSAIYSTTKHAAVGFAENLAISHRDQGIKVSILCPQAVDTAMLSEAPGGPQAIDGVLSPAQVAEAVIEGLAREQFLILPHPRVDGYWKGKTADYDRWLNGMAKLRRKLAAQ